MFSCRVMTDQTQSRWAGQQQCFKLSSHLQRWWQVVVCLAFICLLYLPSCISPNDFSFQRKGQELIVCLCYLLGFLFLQVFIIRYSKQYCCCVQNISPLQLVIVVRLNSSSQILVLCVVGIRKSTGLLVVVFTLLRINIHIVFFKASHLWTML